MSQSENDVLIDTPLEIVIPQLLDNILYHLTIGVQFIVGQTDMLIKCQ